MMTSVDDAAGMTVFYQLRIRPVDTADHIAFCPRTLHILLPTHESKEVTTKIAAAGHVAVCC